MKRTKADSEQTDWFVVVVKLTDKLKLALIFPYLVEGGVIKSQIKWKVLSLPPLVYSYTLSQIIVR